MRAANGAEPERVKDRIVRGYGGTRNECLSKREVAPMYPFVSRLTSVRSWRKGRLIVPPSTYEASKLDVEHSKQKPERIPVVPRRLIAGARRPSQS